MVETTRLNLQNELLTLCNFISVICRSFTKNTRAIIK